MPGRDDMSNQLRARQSPSLRNVFPIIVTVALAALWLPFTVAIFTNQSAMRDDTRAAVRHVVDGLAPGDAVLMSRDNFAIRYYWHMEAQRGVSLPALLAAPYDLHGVLRSNDTLLRDLNASPIQRVRLMLWQDDVVDPQKLIESTLWNNEYALGQTNFGSIRLPLYQVKNWPVVSPAIQPMEALFDARLMLSGVWVQPVARLGQGLGVILRWHLVAPLARTYKMFVHVLDANGNPMFQRDKASLNDLVPTTQWKVGESLQDPFSLLIPSDVPPGDYRIMVGVYDPLNANRRLAVVGTGASPNGDEIQVATVRIVQ